MKLLKCFLIFLVILFATNAGAWEPAKVTNILQHEKYAAIFLSPDPGKGNCEAGSPYLLLVDDTPDSKQKFSMLLTALTTGLKVSGHSDACVNAIWGKTRPSIRRLHLIAN